MNALVKSRNPTGDVNQTVAKPLFLQLRIDEICVVESEVGNVWQLISITQSGLDQLLDVLSNSLFVKVETLEICIQSLFQHLDLSSWVNILCEKLPKLNRLDLVLPVTDVSHIIACVTQVGLIAQSRGIYFIVRLNLGEIKCCASGLKEQENQNLFHFSSVTEILDFLQRCESVADIKLEFTVNPVTVYYMHSWLEFAIARRVPIVYKLSIPAQTTEANFSIASAILDFDTKYHLTIFLENLIRYYETSESQIQFYRSLIGQLMHQQSRGVGCKWQVGGVTLSAESELRYCAIASKALGFALEQDSTNLYRTYQQHWQHILQSACHSCMQDYILPEARGGVSKASKISLRRMWGQASLLKQFKSLKLLKPLKMLRLQVGFEQHLQALGVNSATRTLPQVALHFPAAVSNKKKVLICGWYGTETLGDKAILGGVVQALQEALGEFELHLVAIEVYISQMTVRQMPELQGGILHSLTEGLEIVQSMDLVVFGGGPLMAIGAMAEMMAFFQRAVAAKIPTLLAGCGVGPLGAEFLNNAVRHVLQHSSYRIYRDQKSLENARSLGVDVNRDIVAEDPAFTWLASKTDRWKTADSIQRLDAPRLILGLRDWPYHEFAAEMGSLEAERLKQRFEQEVLMGLEYLVERHSALEIVAFPMCTNHLGFDDRWFYYRLFRDRPKLKSAVDFSYLGAELSPDDSLPVFQAATAALTMRFHSLIFALSNGVPAVAIDYTLGRGKVKSLAEKYQVPYQGLDTISAEFIASALTQLLSGKSHNSVSAFQQRRLTFKDSVKTVIASLKS